MIHVLTVCGITEPLVDKSRTRTGLQAVVLEPLGHTHLQHIVVRPPPGTNKCL